MRQRVMIAMALSCEPQIILADEPTTALDVSVQAQILELLRSATQERDTALVLISHDLSVVAGLADRVAVMDQGKIVRIGKPYEVYENPGSAFVSDFLGRTNLLPAIVIGRSVGRLRLRVGGIEVDAVGEAPGEVTIERLTVKSRVRDVSL